MTGDPEPRSPRTAAEAGACSGPSSADAPADSRSRRELLAAGGGLGLAVLVAGCTSKVAPPSNVELPRHSPQTGRDVLILNRLLAVEYRAIAAYTAGAALLGPPPTPPTTVAQQPSPQPDPPGPPPPLELTLPLASAAAAHFLSQELAHATELRGFIKQVQDHPVGPQPSYDLGHPKSKQDVLVLLRRIEEGQLVAYLDATTALAPGKLRSAVAAIFANHAQHLSVWRSQLGLPPVPSAFVTGRE